MKKNAEEKHCRVAAELRGEIVGGMYKPETRLPTSRELAARFEASSVTINRALAMLIEDGFIRTCGRHGTFVTANPPHLYRYGLVCLHEANTQNRFFRTVMSEAKRFRGGQPRRVVCYFGENLDRQRQSYNHLLDDVQRDRLAGVFFSSTPFPLEGSKILANSSLPRVAVMRPSEEFSGISPISLDNERFLNRSLDYLQERGVRRPAVLTSPRYLRGFGDLIQRSLGAHDVSVPEHWLQSVHLDAPESADHLIQLMFHPDQPAKPDGLLILDDNLTAPALQGFVKLGRNSDLTIVSHANFPYDMDLPMPVKFLGYNVRHLLHTAIDVIDARRRGDKVPSVIPFEPQFDDEFRVG